MNDSLFYYPIASDFTNAPVAVASTVGVEEEERVMGPEGVNLLASSSDERRHDDRADLKQQGCANQSRGERCNRLGSLLSWQLIAL